MNRIALLLCIACWACGGTETDNPLSAGERPGPSSDPDAGVPSYVSKVGLADPSGGIPPCSPPAYDGKPRERPLAASAGQDLFATDSDGHLVWLDLSDPAAPVVKARLSLHARPLELSAGPGPAVTLVLDGGPTQSLPNVPDLRTLAVDLRLVRLEPGDGGLRQVAEVPLTGEFWALRRSELDGKTLHWVAAAQPKDSTPACDRSPFGCYYPSRSALIATGYGYDNGALTAVQTVELPMGSLALTTDAGYVTLVDNTLHYVRFTSEGRLGPVRSLTPAHAPLPAAGLDLGDDQLRLFVRDEDTGAVALAIYDVASDPPVLLSESPLPDGIAVANNFVNGAVYPQAHFFGSQALLEGPNALHFDLRAPSAPTLDQQAYTRIAAWSVEPSAAPNDSAHVVALDATDAGQLSLSLLSVTADGLQELDRLALGNTLDPTGAAVYARLFQDGDSLLVLAPGADNRGHLYRVGLTAVGLSMQGDRAVPGPLDTLLLAAGTPVAIGYDRISVLAEASEDAVLFSLRDGGRVQSEARGPSFVARVRQLPGADGLQTYSLEVTRDGRVDALSLSTPPDYLVADATHVLLVQDHPESECFQTEADCSDYAPNVEVIDVSATPRRAGTVRLPEGPPIILDGTGYVSYEWSTRYWDEAAPRLEDGRPLFIVEVNLSCQQPDTCETLGIDDTGPVSEPSGLQGTCVEFGPDNEPSPCPPPATVEGFLHEQRFYALELADGAPGLVPLGVSRQREKYASFGPPRVSGKTLLATRIERLGPAGTGDARFLLDLFNITADGAEPAGTGINTPGYPLSLSGDGERLLSIARTDDGLTLYSSALRDGHAHVLEQVTLAQSYDFAHVRGPRTWLVTHEDKGCDATTHVFDLSADQPLSLDASLRVHGQDYRSAGALDESLILQWRGVLQVEVDLSEPGMPTLGDVRTGYPLDVD